MSKSIYGRSFVGLICPHTFRIRFSYRRKNLRFPCLFCMMLQLGILSRNELRDIKKQISSSLTVVSQRLKASPGLYRAVICFGVSNRPPREPVLSQLKHSTSSHVTCRSFASTASQLKICDFSGETFKGFEVL